MQRLALALLFVTIVGSLIALAASGVARAGRQETGVTAPGPGEMVQKVSFLCLFCLILYAAFAGAP